MEICGEAFFHEKTKVLVHHIRPGQIAVLNHEDIDEVAAESLLKRNVKAVVNNCTSMTGKFYHSGVKVLMEHGIPVFDVRSAPLKKEWIHGRLIQINHHQLWGSDANIHETYAQVCPYTISDIYDLTEKATHNWTAALEEFASNSFNHAERDLPHLIKCWNSWRAEGRFIQEDVVIVVRGAGFEKDVKWAKKYLPRSIKVIAVDGAADVMLEYGMIPDFIIGDMDSVAAESLGCGAELFVHKNVSGEAPGLSRIQKMKATAGTITFVGMSEDAALAFALKEGAEKIYMIGGHRDMDEFLSKGRPGMGSSLLMKMIAGSKVIDLKGIHYAEWTKRQQKWRGWRKRLHHRFPFMDTKASKEMRGMRA